MTCEVSQAFVDAAVELAVYCRTTPYPQMDTPEFHKLTQLVDALDTEVRAFVSLRDRYSKSPRNNGV
jgi:hypothetical protein